MGTMTQQAILDFKARLKDDPKRNYETGARLQHRLPGATGQLPRADGQCHGTYCYEHGSSSTANTGCPTEIGDYQLHH